jgi:hypothetical protein
MPQTPANPLEILVRGNEILKKDMLELEEMTYSPAVNTRDFSTEFTRIVTFWNQHEIMEEKILEVLSLEGYKSDLEAIMFNKGNLKILRETVVSSIKSGDDERIKSVIKNELCRIIDLLRAHMLAVDTLFAGIDWEKIRKESLTKIQLLQIIPSDKVLNASWKE